MSIKIQYASDLHIEFPANKEFLKQNPLLPVGDVLVLAGDIVPFAVMDRFKDFFSYVSDNFKTTYWLPGNHENYYYDLANKCGTINEKIKSNVFLVNNMAFKHEEIKLVFSTLWSKISSENEWNIERSISDFHVIKYNKMRFSVPVFKQLHEESLAFIKSEVYRDEFGTISVDVQHDNSKTVVVTHHVPTFLNYPEHYKQSSINQAFGVELYDLIETSNINAWIFGHHHANIPSFKIGNTEMLTNQLGYVQRNEHWLFETNKVIEI
jgi:predicted phosphohydrolase